MNEPFKYRGFLSYSHRDKEWGQWLHAAIERYRVPRDLAGKTTQNGSVPAKLRPIFRDRFDLEAGHSLTEQVTTALNQSESLIVLCSPASARSPYVNEEIRLFKASGRPHRVFPIIVDGEPGDPERECFPEMLRAVLGEDGQPTGQQTEPIAADARETGDGRDLALLKIAAGMLGVDLDELRRREQIERRKKLRRMQLLALVMALLAIAATVSTIFAVKAQREAERQRQVAVEAKNEAERRYEQTLDTSLRLIVTKASYESKLKDQSFAVAQIATKGNDLAFNDFRHSDPRGSDYVFLRLAQTLLAFAKDPPFELRDFALERDWLEHGQVIMGNLAPRHRDDEEFRETAEAIEQELSRLANN